MEFDLDLGNSNSEKETQNQENITNNSKKESVDNKLNSFFNELSAANDLEIKVDENLLAEFISFLEDKFNYIIMDDELFSAEEQVDIIRWLDSQRYAFMNLIDKPYLNNKLIIAVTGRFAAGKSSFLNNILDVNLPVDVEPTTAIPTYITYYKELHKGMTSLLKSGSNYMLVSSMFGNKIMQTKFLDKITKENVEDFPIPINQLIQYFVISIKSFLLKNKVIIDTPGIDPADKKGFNHDEKIASEALGLSNVVFWVMDVDDGDLSNISIQFLEKNIQEEQDLVIIINKIDKKPPKEAEKVVNKVIQTIQKSNIKAKNIEVVKFSKKDKNSRREVVNYINNLPVEQTTPLIIEIINYYLTQARKNIVDKIIKTKEYIEYLENDMQALMNLDTFSEESFATNLESYLNHFSNATGKFDRVIKYNTKIQEDFKKITDMFNFESPMFGDDKYYFTSNRWSEFIDNLNTLAITSSDFSSEIWHMVGYNKCIKNQEEKKLEELEKLEDFINKAINEFEKLEIRLKKII